MPAASLLPNLETLDLCDVAGSPTLTTLYRLPGLTALRANLSGGLSDAAFAAITALTGLRALSLALDTMRRDVDVCRRFEEVCRMTGLTKLHITGFSEGHAPNPSLVGLSSLTNLRHLRLATRCDVSVLTGLTSLRSLDFALSGDGSSVAAVTALTALSSMVVDCTAPTIPFGPQATSSALAILASLPSMRELGLTFNPYLPTVWSTFMSVTLPAGVRCTFETSSLRELPF